MEISQINPDGNVYDIKDATSRTEIAQIKAQNAYSTSETNTGKKWIDGKPIYRRVFIHNNPSEDGNPSFTYGTVSDFEQLVDAHTVTISNHGNNQEASEYSAYRRCRVNISGSVASFINDPVASLNVVKYILIVEYTKTTD